MNRNAVTTVLVAGLVLLAGCSGGFTGSPDGTATDESAMDGQTTAETIEGETGTLNMYISDEQNAIGDFEHLNVTITKIGVKPAGADASDDGEDADADDEDDGDESDTETADDDGEAAETDGNETAAETTESGETETETPESDDVEDAETEDTDDADDEADESGESEWIEYEVDNRTVDLTELQGANATKLSSFEVPNGTYEKVFVYVSDVDGTLKDGSDQRVKLPSGKLQLNSEFTVGDGEEVDFVFDITAIKAGNSGKYILKPVISESGTDVEIDDVDERDEDDEREDDEREDERPDAAADALKASFDGEVTAGENATLSVTSDGEPAENATVWVDDERVGTTDANGAYSLAIPDDAEEVEVRVTYEGAETEVEVELDEESDESEDADAEQSNQANQRLVVG